MTLGPYAGFIIASYAATAIVIAGLAAWILRDYASQQRILDDLESRGVKRRSRRDEDEADKGLA